MIASLHFVISPAEAEPPAKEPDYAALEADSAEEPEDLSDIFK